MAVTVALDGKFRGIGHQKRWHIEAGDVLIVDFTKTDKAVGDHGMFADDMGNVDWLAWIDDGAGTTITIECTVDPDFESTGHWFPHMHHDEITETTGEIEYMRLAAIRFTAADGPADITVSTAYELDRGV